MFSSVFLDQIVLQPEPKTSGCWSRSLNFESPQHSNGYDLKLSQVVGDVTLRQFLFLTSYRRHGRGLSFLAAARSTLVRARFFCAISAQRYVR